MNAPLPRTKIVATIGPASRSPDVLRALVRAGMSVARLNFSHGQPEDHAGTVAALRAVAAELDTPVTILQDLQGPKVRVGQLAGGEATLEPGALVELVPLDDYRGQAGRVPVDYPNLAAEVAAGARVLLDDGMIELRVEGVAGRAVSCRVVDGGVLKSRKGVVLPGADLSIPSLTEKDRQDLAFGVAQGVDWVGLSFVRRVEDVRALKAMLAGLGSSAPVLAKIEKPQAVANLDAILAEVDGLMVARGDLGVELSPEEVPLVQKRVIRACNERGVPVITATQMLESMIHEPRPTRAEASDVANAILDGTDAVMLSGESAVGKYPVRAVEMLARIARAVEPHARYVNHPPADGTVPGALAQAINAVDRALELRAIVAFTLRGTTARLVSSERPRAPIVALTTERPVYHALNLLWGVRPILAEHDVGSFEELLRATETTLLARGLAGPGDQVLIVAGLPAGRHGGTNLIKIHTLGEAAG